MSLYADDLLLYVSKAETTISKIIDLLHQFGKVSGYKLNLQKSELMPLNMSSVLSSISIPFKVASDCFTYLGFTVTKKCSDLLEHNFRKPLIQTKQDFTTWSLLPFSLIGRANAVGMMVLPKYLYLFQCLPVFIPGNFFKKLDSAISWYVWNGKQPKQQWKTFWVHHH